jgi:phosphoketolase
MPILSEPPQDMSINNKFARFAQELQAADNARQEAQQRQRIAERLAQKEQQVKKETEAREDRKRSSSS